MQLNIPLPRTPDGRVYRYSPNEDAHPRHFVLGERGETIELDDKKRSRMKLQPGSTRTVCPYSGVIAADDEFTHPEDVKAALKIVEHTFAKDVIASIDQMLSGIAPKELRLCQLQAWEPPRGPEASVRQARPDEVACL